jgi:hypothetical protein
MTISQRGKEYLKTAESLLRAAQTMTDRAIASQLKSLADDYQRRAEKALRVNEEGQRRKCDATRQLF